MHFYFKIFRFVFYPVIITTGKTNAGRSMTSAIIQQGISFIREKKRRGADIKIPRKSSQNDELFSLQEVLNSNGADVLEDEGKLKVRQVEITTEKSGFSYFLDGIERKKILFYYRSIPVIYGYVAGVVLKRTDKKMHSMGFEKSHESFYLPLKQSPESPEHYFSSEELQSFEKNMVNIGKPSSKDGNDYPMIPEQLVQAAHSEIQTKRNYIEESLVKEWIGGGFDDGWLFVDGRLENKSRDLIANSNIIGVIKSHHASYFGYEEQYRIYSMQKGERSGVFQPKNDKGKRENVFSWYLKLHHDKRQGDNNFGLVRVEVPAEERFLKKADIISSWILLETKPVAFPASRWDRMIYPIKYCEDYLKSKAPSWTLIDSLH